ncbi:dipeptide/oligopeptide/nickel ABC transporter permease/ATP-binding protein [Streptomyces sp. NBC_00878]|uniref:dipeptide/oligopeptide/nickel ABC transporter permease/ATP-binding protein n=1 Tax=Streptomyces sp. NBC_00878 TaxID=2975854 RepID=UPI00225490F7|nr:dipeptide/oligopeptide/nickel ABC transporter permease/ATP-binding protein [Streptomyces sp. NBC_00878]MCX4911171.1 dipeptide/oligopeptide/nickel ABC transporter permease/ATP-binding protein [Streptomyces sp. NBC_00878]
MTLPQSEETAVSAAVAARGRSGLLRRLLRSPVAVTCLVLLALISLAGLFAPLLTSQDPAHTSLTDSLAPMSGTHPLGGDGVGRDVLARLLYGGRTSLLGALLAVAVALVIGVPAGLVAGYYRKWFDAVSSWLANLLMAVPAIIVLLVVMSAVGQNTYVAMAVFGVLMSPGVFRLIRASVISVREELYVDAARVSGLADPRIIRRHILPVVQAPTIIQAAQMLGLGIVIQSGLEFLGLGSATQASWGSMLNDAFANIYTKPVLLVWPGVALAVTVAVFGLLGNALRDALDASAASGRKPRGAAAAGKQAVARKAQSVASASSGTSGTSEAGEADDTLLVLEDLKVSYPTAEGEKTVVDGVSLTVRRGEVLGLVGESGSGKSQTAFAVLGLLPREARVSRGRLVFDGKELGGLGRAEMNRYRGRRIAYVPQEPMSNLDPSFRIGAQLVEPVRRHLGLSAAEAKAKTLALLERVGIADPERVFTSYPHQISGGMAQRVLIAGAVSCEPDLLIADEPTTALDVTVQAEVLDLVRSLQRERNMGVILVTHDFGVVADICDRVTVLQTGRVVESAPVRQLFADPRHPYTRMLLASTLEDAEPRSALSPSRTAPASVAAVTNTARQEGPA